MAHQNQNITDSQQTRAYAAYYGFWVGACWIICFALFIYGLTVPFVGDLGLLVGLCSLLVAVRLMRGFRDTIAPLPLRRAFSMGWLIFMAAALLTTAAQYIYFAYLDDGLLTRSYSELIQQPEVHEMLQKMMPAADIDALSSEMMTTFAATPPSQLAFTFLFWNTMLATILAIPAALLSYSRQEGSTQS